MVTKYVGKQGWAGIALETTEGTAVEPQVYIPYDDFDASDDLTTVTPKEHRGSLDDTFSVIRTAVENKVSLKTDVFAEMGFEHILAGTFGTPTKSGTTTTGVTYTFAQSNTPPSATLHSGISSAGAILPRVYTNALVDTFKFSIKEKEQAKLDVSYVSQPVTIDTTDSTPTYSANQPVPFVFPELKFSWADYGTTATQDMMIQGIDFEIKKDVKSEFTANNSLSPSIFAPTGFAMSGSFSRIFQDLSEYKKFLGSANATSFQSTQIYKNCKLEMTGKSIPSTTPSANYKFSLDIPRMLITKCAVKYSGEDILKMDFDWMALKDVTAGYTAQATVTSGLAPTNIGLTA